MRRTLIVALTLAAAALSSCGRKDEAPDEAAAPTAPVAQAPSAPAAPPVPTRKPGIWELRMSMQDVDFVQVSRLCIDAATDERLSILGPQNPKDQCRNNQATRRMDGSWMFSSVCDMGSGGVVTTAGTVTGDFNAKYLVQAKSSTTGAAVPQMNGEREVNIEAQWTGPCAAAMKGGDMVVNGMTINVLELGQAGG